MSLRSSQDSSATLGPVGEGEWQRLRRQFELATDPWLGFIFCPAPRPVAALRQRTEFTLQYRARQMRRIHPESPDELRELMPKLFASLPDAGCVWVEVIAVDSPILDDDIGPWVGAWDWLTLRLNERRDALRRRLAGPLIFAVHPEWKPRLRDAAPDLWSVRSLVLDLPGNEGRPAIDRFDASEEASKATDDLLEHVTSVEEAEAALRRLEEVPSPEANSLARLHMYMASALLADDRAGDATEHADRAVANAPENTRLRAQALTVAARAKLQAANDVAAALQHLQHAIDVWRSILNRDGETPQTLRDLSHPLDEMGQIRETAGETDAARAVYEEALTIDRRLTEMVGETPQTLRTLSVSLCRLGGIHEHMDETAAAKAVYEESLAITRRLTGTIGENPQTLRDLSISLERIGRVHETEGDAAAAEATYEESLAIRRRLVETVGENPQTLRDLSISLERMGRVETEGDAAAAEATYEESLAIRRRLVETVGENPQTLRDLSVSLEGMGRVHEAAGETDAAKAVYEESLAIARRLTETFGETPETLRDLSVSLGRLGGVHEHAGETAAAKAAYEESLAIARRLIKMIGETPQTLRDLSVSLDRLDRIQRIGTSASSTI